MTGTGGQPADVMAQISGDLLGLSVWMFLSFVAATALFRWE